MDLTNNVQVLVYGTLRKGMYNSVLLKAYDTLQYQDTNIKIPGYVMYDMGGYPAVFKGTGEDTIECDILLTNRNGLKFMDDLEISHGYKRVTVNYEGTDFFMYIHTNESIKNNREQIPDGVFKLKSDFSCAD